MPQFQDYFGQAALRPQADIPRSLDQLYEMYLQRKQAAAQQAQQAQAGNMFALQEGFNPNQVTPQNIAQAQGPANMVESPAIAAMRQYIERKKGARDLETRKTEAEIGKLNAEADSKSNPPSNTYNAAQTAAIMSGDAQKMADAFPEGVPKSAISPATTAMGGARIGGQNTATNEAEMRKEFNSLSKDYFSVRDSFNRIKAVSKNATAAGDLALIFNYMKMLDPGSTVREGEFATAQNSAGVPERIVAAYNKVKEGTRLAPAQREDFVNRAADLFDSQRITHKKRSEQYRGLAESRGYKPENVVLPDVSTDVQGSPAKVDPAARFNELKAQGLSDDDAYKRMAQEGH